MSRKQKAECYQHSAFDSMPLSDIDNLTIQDNG